MLSSLTILYQDLQPLLRYYWQSPMFFYRIEEIFQIITSDLFKLHHFDQKEFLNDVFLQHNLNWFWIFHSLFLFNNFIDNRVKLKVSSLKSTGHSITFCYNPKTIEIWIVYLFKHEAIEQTYRWVGTQLLNINKVKVNVSPLNSTTFLSWPSKEKLETFNTDLLIFTMFVSRWEIF